MLQKTELAWGPYMYYLELALLDSKFHKRAGDKPMSTPKGDAESHLTSRVLHERMTAIIADIVATGIELNGQYAYYGMIGHDSGHPFSAHEGEEIFNIIGRTYNTGFFHHNAKGVEVILSEDICDKAINMIPGIENNPELRRQLEEEFYYFLDIVVSHDGEATRSDMKKEAEQYGSMKEAVFSKIRKANSQNDHRGVIAQTDEGKLGKIADVLAYFPTDIQDGFRLKILKEFDDDYLEVFGAILLKGRPTTKEEKIKIAKQKIKEIKIQRMRDNRKEMQDPDNQRIIGIALEILDEAKKSGIDVFSPEKGEKTIIKRLVERKIEELANSQNFGSEEEKQFFYSDMSKLREFTSKMISTGSGVVTDVTNIMRNYFIENFTANAKKTGKLAFSKRAEKIFFRIKFLNYEKLVKYTKWDYQSKQQPDAAKILVENVAKSLIASGIIRDKFYDKTIRKYITDEEALRYMTTPIRDEKDYIRHKANIKGRKTIKGIKKNEKGFAVLTKIKNRFKNNNGVQDKRDLKDKVAPIKHAFKKIPLKSLRRKALYRSVNQYARKEGENFAIKYMNVFYAIPYTVEKNVDYALENDIEQHDMLQDFQRQSNKKILDRMIGLYGSLENAKARKKEFIDMLVQEERKKMEEKMAIQLAIDYLSGMTDRSFNDIAIQTGYMKRRDIIKAKRGTTTSQKVEEHAKRLEEEQERWMRFEDGIDYSEEPDISYSHTLEEWLQMEMQEKGVVGDERD